MYNNTFKSSIMQEEISGFGSQDRKWYETVKAKYTPSQPTLGALRQEITLKNNQSSYEFDFKTRNANSASEQLLSITDAFAANKIGIFLLVRNIARKAANVLTTYPNREYIAPAFAGSTVDFPTGPALLAINDLETVYNGTTSVRVDTNTIFDGLDTRRFRCVPETQVGLFATQTASKYGEGLVAIEPQLFFDGARRNLVTVSVPTFNGMAIEPDNPNSEIVLVCVAAGFRIQGGARLKE